MKNIKTLGISLAVITALSFSGCGSSSSGDSTPPEEGKKITGSITGNGYAKLDLFQKFMNGIVTPAYALDANSPDKIVVMYDGGKSKYEFNINADGSFEIDTSLLSKDDLVIFVVNSSTKKVFGHLNLGTSSSEKLDFIDKSKLENDLDLGSVDTENNCSSSTTVSNTTAFSNDDLASLEEVAISDNVLILYQNLFKNPDYEAQLHNHFKMPTITSIKDTFNSLNDFNSSNFTGSQPVITTSITSWADINYSEINYYPPSSVTCIAHNGATSDANTTVTMPGNYKTNNDDEYFYSFDYIKEYPTGNWLLKDDNNVTKATFVLSDASPFDSNGKVKVPVPMVKANMSGNIISSIEVKWLISKNNSYTEISEKTMQTLATVDADKPFIILQNSSTPLGRAESDTFIGTYSITEGNNLEIGTASGKVEKIIINYMIGQGSYQYIFSENH
jgi:hypothetical protein